MIVRAGDLVGIKRQKYRFTAGVRIRGKRFLLKV